MKHILTLTLLFISFFSCKAQQTVGLYDGDPNLPEDTYYKDLNNDLDKFVGTWKWQEDGQIFTITFEKKTHVNNPTFNQFEDMIIGEYKYEVNGQETLNYLPRLQNPNIVGNQHYISGNLIFNKNNLPKCNECSPFEKRLRVSFRDPEREYIPCALILRHQTINGVEQLTADLIGASSYTVLEENLPNETRVPFGQYILIKQ